jgi:hypothetical protein
MPSRINSPIQWTSGTTSGSTRTTRKPETRVQGLKALSPPRVMTRSGVPSCSAKARGREPEVTQLVVMWLVSEGEFELLLGSFESMMHEQTKYLYHVRTPSLYRLLSFNLVFTASNRECHFFFESFPTTKTPSGNHSPPPLSHPSSYLLGSPNLPTSHDSPTPNPNQSGVFHLSEMMMRERDVLY